MFSEEDIQHHLIIEIFPECIIHSPPTRTYNCFAWAIHEEDAIDQEIKERFWWPNEIDSFWPDDAAEDTLETFETFFRDLGYEITNSSELEPNYAKIAIYVIENNQPYHVARQLALGEYPGAWTSKCGSSHDIIHHQLADLEGEVSEGRYGTVALIMKKFLQ